jgi:hypothetical protein
MTSSGSKRRSGNCRHKDGKGKATTRIHPRETFIKEYENDSPMLCKGSTSLPFPLSAAGVKDFSIRQKVDDDLSLAQKLSWNQSVTSA